MINNKDLNSQYAIFSDNVKYYRKQSRLTQEQLAELADLSISYVKQIESNNEYKNISLTTILKISKEENQLILFFIILHYDKHFEHLLFHLT